MNTVNIDQYRTLAADIRAFSNRDSHLIAEMCLDVYPVSQPQHFKLREYIRAAIVQHLQANKGA